MDNNSNNNDIDSLITEHYVPHYILQEYKKYYINQSFVNFLNKPWVNNIRLFWQQNKLHNLVINNIQEKDKVLLIGNCYGKLTTKIINKIGIKGTLDVLDVLPNQLLLVKQELKDITNSKNLNVILQDAKNMFYRKYNLIIMFFFLGEIPNNYKYYVLKNVLRLIDSDNSKLIVVDYHHPSFYNPLINMLKFNNFFFKPYTAYLWDNEIANLIDNPFNYNIQKTTYFGNVYQQVLVTKLQ